MATGKQGFVRAAEPQHSVSMQREREMRIQAPLTTMYIQPMPGLPACSPGQPTAMRDAAVIPLPLMCANQALPILTLHIASGAAVQQQRHETPVTSPRPKSAGKHVCPHCGRDCLKPSVLEKHLRCHTGERPYPCTTCGISFKTQSNLYKHKRTQAHARLQSESGKGAFSSQESTESLRETCSSPSLEFQSEESSDINKTDSVLPAATTTTYNSSVQVTSTEGKATSATQWALHKAAVVGLIASPVHGQHETLNSADQRIQLASNAKNEATSMHTKIPAGDGRAPLTPNRTPLQRQEALFSKLSRGKSQSHDSTDSGFSEGSEQHLTSSPGDALHESMESLPEASVELQESGSSNKPSDVTEEDAKSQKVSVQEKQKLEEHILKLISENSVLVDDKHLVNVRPRKTVLSKQGSIDLPMPYTYKDSFHFDMRSSKHQVSSSQTPDRRGRVMYSSVPTQHSTSLEHAPLTRSSSLPFSVSIQNNDRTTFPYQEDSIPLSRRCSAGNIYPFKSVDQHGHGHRSLVRQIAVDCLSIAEGISTEKGSQSSLSSDGDCGDISTESGVKRCRRKKAQKFAYNKWYMYGGGGTFKKLYSSDKDSLLKGRKTAPSQEQTESQGIQINHQRPNNSSVLLSSIPCSATSLPPAVNVFTSQTSTQVVSSYELLQSPLTDQTGGQKLQGLAKKADYQRSDLNVETNFKSDIEGTSPIPSERKKQKTEDDPSAMMGNTDTLMRQKCLKVLTSRNLDANTNLRDVISQSLQSVCGDVFHMSSMQSALDRDHRSNLHRQDSFSIPATSNQMQLLFKRHSSPLFGNNVSVTSDSPSASSTISSVSQAKTSFLPKYQLKIPCSTDGVSDPGVSKHSSLDQPSLSQQSAQQRDPDTSTITSKPQNQSVSITMSTSTAFVACTGLVNASQALTHHHHQPETNTSTSVISATPTLASLIPEDKLANVPTQNQCSTYTVHSKSRASTPSVLSQPLQTFTAFGQNKFVVVGTTHSTDASVSHSPTSTKSLQLSATSIGSVVLNNPATSVVISSQQPGLPLDTHAPACQSSLNGISLEISQTGFQGAGAQFEGKMLLANDSQPLAQDTFYVRTADLQIVMQLISDEQLALIEPQIEKQALSKLDGSHLFLNNDSEISLANTISAGVSHGIHKQCPDHTGTKQCLEQGNVNVNKPSEIPDTTQISAGSTVTNEMRSTENPCNLHPHSVYVTESCPKGVISSSGSKAEHHVLALMDSASLLQQQSTRLIPTCEDGGTSTNPKLAGCCQDTSSNQEVPLSIVQKKQPKSCWIERASPATERQMSPGSALAYTACQYKSLNQRGVCKTDSSKLNHEAQGNRTYTPSQASVRLSKQHCSTLGAEVTLINIEEDAALTTRTVHVTSAFLESDKPMSETTQEESSECGEAPCGTEPVNQDLFTGPRVGGSLQSSQLQREAGTESQGWIAQEPESEGGDGVRVGNQRLESEDHAKENEKEGATETHDNYQTATEPQSLVSQPVTHTCHNTSSAAELDTSSVSGKATALSGETSLSHDFHRAFSLLDNSQHVKQSASSKTPKLIGQSEANKTERAPLECQERLTLLSTGPSAPSAGRHLLPTCGHLLAHPLLVNAIQKEVQKETQMKNNPTATPHASHARALQEHRPFSENKRDEPPMTTLSSCDADSNQTINTTPAQKIHTTCPNPTNNINSVYCNPTCASTAHHHTPSEPNATQCHLGGCYLEEEESSSSSDDEGKLVIELE